MSFDKVQITTIIRETLIDQELYSEVALNLLLGTMAKESDFGTYLYQKPSRIAKGIFQMESATERDIWDNYLYLGRVKKREAIYRISGVRSANNNEALTWNIAYAICMARLHYRRIPEPFPEYDNIEALGMYWDTHWNRNPEEGTVQQFIEKWDQFIGGKEI